MNSHIPRLVIILSGKRKSGKDHIACILQERIGYNECSIFRLSAPLKQEYAKVHGLQFDKLLDSSEYKEHYREDMIKWGEERRNKDPNFFIDLMILSKDASKPIWIVSDARRTSDIDCLKRRYHIKTVRVSAMDEIRCKRGWIFTNGVDDEESECGLDDYKFDFHCYNNDDKSLQEFINNFIQFLKLYL